MLYMNRSMTIMVLKALRRSVHKVFSLPRMKWLKKHQLLTIITVLATLSMLQVIMEIKFLKPRKASSVHISSVGNQCVDVHLAVGASGIYQRKRLAIMIKSILLYSSRVMLHLHLLVDNINKHRIDIFLSTWNLTQVVPHYYENDGLVQDFNSLAQIAGYLFRNKHLLRNISKMILAESVVYFTSDLSVLWNHIDDMLINEMAANVKSIPTSPPQGEHSMHLTAYIGCRNTSKELDKLNNNDFLVTLDIDIKSDLPLHVLDVHSNSIENGVITQIDKSDGDLFREIMPSCARKYDSIKLWKNECDLYTSIATMTRRTHLYFIDNMARRQTKTIANITLVTQLMINRINHLERLLQSWRGPSQVALYLTDEEIIRFTEYYNKSRILRKANATYHVIFKRHNFYPINYVRNIAIRETNTPFYIMIDVDFATPPTLYDSISSYLNELKPNEKKVFVIPVFEAFHKMYELPSAKEQLLSDIDQKKVISYHQAPGLWKFGHRKTNYNKWKNSKTPYKVTWEYGYEPYVVVPTGKFLYDEILLERMRDKLTYTFSIAHKGYTFYVLPFDFLIHIPHEKSRTLQYHKGKFARYNSKYHMHP